MFYYLKINNGYPFCIIGGQEEKIMDYKEQFGQEIYEYECDIIPNRLIVDNGVVVIPNETQLRNIDIENYVVPFGYYIKNDEVVSIPVNESFMVKPKFDEQMSIWVETATLEEYQQYKRKELQQCRDAEIVSDYDYNSHILQGTLLSQDKLFKAMSLGINEVEWVLADNTTTIFTHDDLANIVNGIAVREQQAFDKFNTLYGQVLLCETIDEIKLINWN